MGTIASPKQPKYSLRQRLDSLFDCGEPLIPGDTIEQLLADLKGASGCRREESKPLSYLTLPDGRLTIALISMDREDSYLCRYPGTLDEAAVLKRFAAENPETIGSSAIVESLDVLDISIPR